MLRQLRRKLLYADQHNGIHDALASRPCHERGVMSSTDYNQLTSYRKRLTHHIRYLRGPVAGTRFTRAYARLVAREAYFWAWPMVNLYNRKLACAQITEPCLLDGLLPAAPLNSLAMLHDYIDPQQHIIACPDQDMIYG